MLKQTERKPILAQRMRGILNGNKKRTQADLKRVRSRLSCMMSWSPSGPLTVRAERA